ncbi:MAG: 3-phosphoshikimate 1-carboxyvinyltransferase, partial [Actinomycetia bacterium]|nr:3-phosphoshikimate 1-carboxyvinyltransferase [Actinomycetes bacterium]
MPFCAPSATKGLSGEVRVPADKSISHRLVLFSALAQGTSHLRGVLDCADLRSTLAAVGALGATVHVSRGACGLDVDVTGWGPSGPSSPPGQIDCGNSGTTARLLAGALAGYDVVVTLVGDESLSRRPMSRVTGPLSAMGAHLVASAQGTLPLTIEGTRLHGAHVDLNVASAQVKSAVLLAGLRAEGRTTVCEPAPSRDHTERMLPAFGVEVVRDAGCASVTGPALLHAIDAAVPGDPSSAAFFAGAAAIVPRSDVVISGVSLNPTRTGFLRVLERMGAHIEVTPGEDTCGEPTGDVRVLFTDGLCATDVEPEEVPALIDEVPLLAVVATQATGVSRFRRVGELRVKESDRLRAIVEGLGALGAHVWVEGDDLLVSGPGALHAASLDSLGDHRLAMAYAVAALVAEGGVRIER